MTKVKTIVKNDKIYQSLEQWKNDFLPNAVKTEHLLFIKAVENRVPEIPQTDTISIKETLNLSRLAN